MPSRHHAILLAMVGILLLATRLAFAADLLVHYDVNDPKSWSGGVLKDLAGKGTDLKPSAGAATDGRYGAPAYTPADGAGGRAYLKFTKFGILGPGGVNSAAFAPADGGKLVGYSIEMYLFLGSDMEAAENTGIGFRQNTSHENQFIAVLRGKTDQLLSNTQTTDSDQRMREANVSLKGLFPRDRWLHVVKVYDPTVGEGFGAVRWYVDGELKKTDNDWKAEPGFKSPVRYTPRDETFGGVGDSGREIRGIGYSLFRAYRGALEADEIKRLHRSVTGSATSDRP